MGEGKASETVEEGTASVTQRPERGPRTASPGEEGVRDQLRRALAECERLRRENDRLKAQLARQAGSESPTAPKEEPPAAQGAAPPSAPAVHTRSPSPEKIHLFRSLFRGREDVNGSYPARWMRSCGSWGV